MWLIFLPLGVEKVSRFLVGRVVCYLALAISMFSVGYALAAPWTYPWLQRLFTVFGWIDY
jgi:hypothetical protein